MSLCARLSAHRPLRTWFVDLLAGQGLHHAEGLDYVGMMRLHEDSRLVPNECIANEINFRFLEAASSGCLVLSPDVEEDQDALLAPGKEYLIYQDGRELLDQLVWLRRKPETVERLGRAALERVQAEHLPEHRAQALLHTASRLTSHRLRGAQASLALWLALSAQIRNNALPLDSSEHARQGLELARQFPEWSRLPLDVRPLLSHTLAECLCLLAESREEKGGACGEETAKALDLCRCWLAPDAARPFTPGHNAASPEPGLAAYDCPVPAATLELSATASALALREGELSLEHAYWRQYTGGGSADTDPDAFSLCENWPTALYEERRAFFPGFQFRPEAGMLPQSDLTWLYFAEHLVPERAHETYARKESLLALRLDLLAPYLESLDKHLRSEPGNWRLQQEYGRACIKACRVDEGATSCRKREKREPPRDRQVHFESTLVQTCRSTASKTRALRVFSTRFQNHASCGKAQPPGFGPRKFFGRARNIDRRNLTRGNRTFRLQKMDMQTHSAPRIRRQSGARRLGPLSVARLDPYSIRPEFGRQQHIHLAADATFRPHLRPPAEPQHISLPFFGQNMQRFLPAHAEPAPLPLGVLPQPFMRSHPGAVPQQHGPRPRQLHAKLSGHTGYEITVFIAGHKTDFLAFARLRRRQAPPLQSGKDFAFTAVSQREHGFPQGLSRHQGKKIALVFKLIATLNKSRESRPCNWHPLREAGRQQGGVVPRGQTPRSKRQGRLKKQAELDAGVAENAGIGGQPTGIALHKRADHLAGKGRRQVSRMQGNAETTAGFVQTVPHGGRGVRRLILLRFEKNAVQGEYGRPLLLQTD